jgi:hypothetical protein
LDIDIHARCRYEKGFSPAVSTRLEEHVVVGRQVSVGLSVAPQGPGRAATIL